MPAKDDEQVTHSKRWTFDPTINAGHLLTFAGFLLMGLGIYSALDKRVVVLEANQATQLLRDQTQDAYQQQSTLQVKEKLDDVVRSIEKIDNKIDRLTP